MAWRANDDSDHGTDGWDWERILGLVWYLLKVTVDHICGRPARRERPI
jgi:hypothetical protein